MYSHIREAAQNNKPKGKILTEEVVEDAPRKETNPFIYHEKKSFSPLRALIGIASLASLIFGVYLVWMNIAGNQKVQNNPPVAAEYTCPTAEYVDCMPGVGIAKPECEAGYLTWAQANCPNFKGAAY